MGDPAWSAARLAHGRCGPYSDLAARALWMAPPIRESWKPQIVMARTSSCTTRITRRDANDERPRPQTGSSRRHPRKSIVLPGSTPREDRRITGQRPPIAEGAVRMPPTEHLMSPRTRPSSRPSKGVHIAAAACLILAFLVLAGSADAAPRLIAPTPTLTPTVLWTGDVEEGNFSDWTNGTFDYDGCWSNGGATCAVSSARAHTGAHSLALTTANNGVQSSGARMAKTQAGPFAPPLPTDAVYTAWYYMPQRVSVPVWWNIMQWKQHGAVDGSDPIYTVNVLNRADGSMFLRLYKHIGTDGNYDTPGNQYVDSAAINVPVGQWWKLTCRYRFATSLTGRVTCWQGGQLIWDRQNVQTQYNYSFPADRRPFQWTVNNYSDDTDPGTHTIYVDDATIRRRGRVARVHGGSGGVRRQSRAEGGAEALDPLSRIVALVVGLLELAQRITWRAIRSASAFL
jgi:hypothetical protein